MKLCRTPIKKKRYDTNNISLCLQIGFVVSQQPKVYLLIIQRKSSLMLFMQEIPKILCIRKLSVKYFLTKLKKKQ